jgi:hypothetical protein
LKRLLTILSLLFSIALNAQWAVATGSTVGRQLVIQVPITDWGQQTQALLWMPDDTAAHPGRRYALMIYLHGSGQGETNNINEQLEESLPKIIGEGFNPYGIDSTTGDTVKYIVVSPHAYNTNWSYSFTHIKWILKYLKESTTWKNRIDTARVFVSGFSAGGFGTWSCVSEDSTWVRANLTGIVAISAVEYNTDEPHKVQIRGATRAKTAIWQVCGANDAWNNTAIKYDSIVNNTPVPLPFRYGYKVVPLLSHEAGVWTEVYRPTVFWFRGKTLWSRLADYTNIAGPAPPPPPTPVATVDARGDSTMTISPVGSNWNMTGTDTGYLYAVPNGITGTVTYQWTQVSGPNTARILFPTGQSTPVDNMVVGTYTFQVAATGTNGTFTDQVVRTVRLCTPGTPEYHMGIGADGGTFLGDMSGYLPGSRIWMDSATFPQRTWIYGEKVKGAPGCYVTVAPYGYCEGKDAAFDISGEWWELDGSPMNQFTKRRTKVGMFTTITTSLFFDGRWKERKADGTIEIFNQTGGPVVSIQRGSSNCYIHDIELTRRKYFFAFKDDDQCPPNGDTIYNHPYSVIHDIRLVRAYGHYSESQFLYEGNTAPNNDTLKIRAKSCSLSCGTRCFFEPGRQGDNEVSYCIADSNGRSNIQPSGQEVGMSRYFKNELHYPGGQGDVSQPSNFFFGGYSQAICDSNFCTNALTFGIAHFGTRLYLYGNIIDSSGYAAMMQRWVWSGPVGSSTVIDVLPDTAVWTAYGSAFQASAHLTIPNDPSMVWAKNNAVHAERTADLNNADKSVFYIYSAPGMNNATAWVTDNRFDGNTYNGAPITGPWQISSQAGISFNNNSVPYINQVSAGRDYIIRRPWHELIGKAKALNGTTIISVHWQQLSGPSSAILSNPNSLQSYVSGLVNGHYVFQFTATNNAEIVTSDFMTIDVEGVTPSGNPPPAASAGGNQTITGTSVSLNGFGTAGAGTITGYAWTRISGPNTPTITSPTSANTTVTGLIPGIYIFRFTVTQTDAQTASNDSQVTVVVFPFLGRQVSGRVGTPYKPYSGKFKRKTF